LSLKIVSGNWQLVLIEIITIAIISRDLFINEFNYLVSVFWVVLEIGANGPAIKGVCGAESNGGGE
jgi:hypothetical protein